MTYLQIEPNIDGSRNVVSNLITGMDPKDYALVSPELESEIWESGGWGQPTIVQGVVVWFVREEAPPEKPSVPGQVPATVWDEMAAAYREGVQEA